MNAGEILAAARLLRELRERLPEPEARRRILAGILAADMPPAEKVPPLPPAPRFALTAAPLSALAWLR